MIMRAVKNTTFIYAFLCTVTVSVFAAPFQNSSSDKAKLNNVTSAISNTQSEIKRVSKKRQLLENQLKKDELAISSVTKNITNNKKIQKKVQNDLYSFVEKKMIINKDKIQQENTLSNQLRAAHASGNNDYLKLLLNQKNPTNIQRTLTYYKYINDARIIEINNYKETINKLVTLEKEQQQKVAELNLVQQKLTKDKHSLESNKKSRSNTIASLKKEQLSKEQQLKTLLSEEQNLKSALDQLAQTVNSKKNLAGLAKLKRKLSWPVSGRIKHRFGTQKQGYIKWKGVLKSAPLGEHVKAIYDGTILFSDWLKGYGLVTIIDHGKGYMSLYGHNQTLLKNAGDYVEKGEPIALVGQSGGQIHPGLYFEIRHLGRALNPKLWCR